jgi:diketogulonate reductase-like aldo/keto reductase
LKYKPAVNQVEINFWNPQPELLKVRSQYYLMQVSIQTFPPVG